MAEYSNPQAMFIRGEDGGVIDSIAPSEETANAWKTTKQIYKDSSGNWVAKAPTEVKMAANGDINVIAPKSYFSNDSLKNVMDETALTQISKLYKANADAKIANPFSDKEGDEITIPEFIKSFDDALKDYSAIDYGTNLTRYAHRENLGDKANDITEQQYIIMNTTGAEAGAKPTSMMSVPTAILDAFPSLKNLGSYKNNFFSRGDFLNEFYNLDKTSRDDIHKVHDIVDEYFAKGDFSNLDEYSRMYAFRRFIKTVEPSAGFWSAAGINVESGVIGGATGLAKFGTGVMNLVEMAWNTVMFTNQFNIFQLPATVATGVKGYGDPRISTTFFKGLDEGLQQHISEQQEDYYQLHRDAAAIYTLSELGAEIAANIATGKAVANVITNSALLNSAEQIATETGRGIDTAWEIARAGRTGGNLIGSAGAGVSSAETLREALITNLTGTANPNKLQLLKALATTDGSNIYNSIDSLVKASAATAYGLENVASTASTGAFVSTAGASVDAGLAQAALATQAAEQLKSTIDASLATLKSSLRAASVENFFAQVAVDTASYDGLAWRKYLDGDPDADTLSELMWRTGVNAGIYAGALGLGKLITKFPASEAGQKANVKARKAVYSTAETVSKWNDDIKDHLPATLKEFYKKHQSAASKRAAQYSDLLRGANKIVAETGDASKKIAMESALDNMWFGVNNRIAEYNSDFFPMYKGASVAAADAEKGLIKLLNEAGIGPEAPIAILGKGVASNRSIPQDLINYIEDYKLVMVANTYTDEQIAMAKLEGKDIAGSKEVAEARMARTREKYPATITDYLENTWVLAHMNHTYQANRIADQRHVLNRPWYEGVISSGHFGENGELWFPSRTITEYQKAQMDARNSLSREISGDLPNRNEPEQWSYAWDGKEHDYVHPGLVLDNYIRSIASRDLRREGLIAGIDIYGQDVLFTGDENTAAEAYRKNRSHIKKASDAAIKTVSDSLKESGLAKNMATKGDIRKQQKKIAKKEQRISDLLTGNVDVKVTGVDTTNVINTLSNEQLEQMLGSDAVRSLTQTSEEWDEFWKNASRPIRRDIRASLEKTANQTGFGEDTPSELTENRADGETDNSLVTELNEAIAKETGEKPKLKTKGAITYDEFQNGMHFDPALEEKINRSLLNNKFKENCK